MKRGVSYLQLAFLVCGTALVALPGVATTAQASSSAPISRTDRDRDELRGPVRLVVTTRQSLKKQQDGSIDTFREPVSSDLYDRAGNLTEHKEFSVDFTEDQHVQRVDPNTMILRSNMGDKRKRVLFDAGGNQTESWMYMGADGTGMLLDHTRYAYDSDGRLVRIQLFDADGKSQGFTLFTRDSQGQVTQEEFHYGSSSPMTWTFARTFDSHGNWIEQFESGNDPANGKLTNEPLGIRFRTITYYD